MSDQMQVSSGSPAEEKQNNSGENKDDPTDMMMEQDDEDADESSGDEDEEENVEGSLQKAKQALTCRKVTLITLMDEGIIEPGQGVLSIDYLGQRFEADLLESGKIKWQGSEEEFGTPSAWALHCKRLVNPVKRSGCGWASMDLDPGIARPEIESLGKTLHTFSSLDSSVKFKGKKLDVWKSVWARKHRTSPFKSPHALSSPSASAPVTTASVSALTTTATATPSSFTGATTAMASLSTTSTSQSDLSASIATPCSIDSASTSTEITTSIEDKCSTSSLLSPSSSSASSSKSLSALLSKPPLDPTSIMSVSLTAVGNVCTPIVHESVKESSSDVPYKELVSPPIKDAISNSNSTAQQKSPIKAAQGEKMHDVPFPLMPVIPVHPSPSLPLVIPPSVPTGSKRPSSIHQTTPHKEPTNQTRTNTDVVLRDRKCMRYSDLDMRTADIDMNTLVQCEKFDNHKKLQPFSVLVSTNAMLLMDFHCHLTRSEVVGYLGGHWDAAKQILTVEQAFPILCRFSDKLQAPVVEEEIRRRMKSRKLMLVGWYHSHPYCLPQPSLRDVDCQMAYQLQMRGAGSSYHPCVGFIEAPFEKQDNCLQGFWVMPNLEHPASLNIPMHISYSVRRDLSLTEDVLIDMKLLSEFYSGAPDRVRFKERWKDELSYLDKIRTSLATKLPEDQLNSGTFLDYMQQLLRDMK